MSSWHHRLSNKIPSRIPYFQHVDYSNSSLRVPYSESVAFPDTYQNALQRIDTFQESNKDALITFIIPTIHRITLIDALASMLRQTNKRWKAIIVFDGCLPDASISSILSDDSRFLYLSVAKTGELMEHTKQLHNRAGRVRNIGMSLVTTPWIGFLDDDDALRPNYVQSLMEEITITPTCDAVLFRMATPQHTIVPPANCTTLSPGFVGISFCIKTTLFQQHNIQFEQSDIEDYMIIKKIYDAKYKIVLSPHITYSVRCILYHHHDTIERYVIN
jgi:glycosyltransferase involved in cell wall biosynthesis